MASKLGTLGLTEGEMRSPRSRNPCSLAAGGSHGAPTPTPQAQVTICTVSLVHSLYAQSPRAAWPEAQGPAVTHHTPNGLSDPVTPNAPSAHGLELAILPSRAPGPGPNGLRRPRGTGAAGREEPGLIGNPGNKEG